MSAVDQLWWAAFWRNFCALMVPLNAFSVGTNMTRDEGWWALMFLTLCVLNARAVWFWQKEIHRLWLRNAIAWGLANVLVTTDVDKLAALALTLRKQGGERS